MSTPISTSRQTNPSLSSLADYLYPIYIPKENATNSKPYNALETAFGKFQQIEHNTNLSQQAINHYEFQIASHKKRIEQDKIDRELAVKNVLEQVSKFNQDYPNDPLDMTLDVSIIYKQYLFLKEKIAFKASTSGSGASGSGASEPGVFATKPITTNLTDLTDLANLTDLTETKVSGTSLTS